MDEKFKEWSKKKQNEMIKIADEESELLNLKAPEPAKMPDVRDVTSYEMYHSVNELSTPIPELRSLQP